MTNQNQNQPNTKDKALRKEAKLTPVRLFSPIKP